MKPDADERKDIEAEIELGERSQEMGERFLELLLDLNEERRHAGLASLQRAAVGHVISEVVARDHRL